MKKDLQKLANAIVSQRKVVLFVTCVVLYVGAIIFAKTTALASNPSTDVVAAKLPAITANAQTTEATTEQTTESYQDKVDYYTELYGSAVETTNKVVVNGHEFDYIPGAPYSVYESMAKALDAEVETETVYIPNEEYYSENTSNTETGSITAAEETTVEETEAPAEDTDEMTSKFTEAAYTPGELRYHGVLYWNDSKWTWYSEKVLPGGGLSIPGRHLDDDGFVCDEDGYICLAADPSYISYGTVIDTPFGRPGKIYDSGCAYGTVDVYVGW